MERIRVPSIPYPLDLFSLWRILLESVDLITDFQGNDIPMDERVICRSRNVGEGRYSCPIRVMGVATGLRKRMNCVAIDNEWKGFPYAFLSAGGAIRHGFSG